MSDGGGYPYGDTARALEQMGWLKAQMDNCASKEDIARLEGRFAQLVRKELDARDSALRGEADQRDQKMIERLTDAFRQAMPGTQAMVDQRIQSKMEEKQLEFEAKLKKKGLKIGDTGEVEHMVHPIVRHVKRNFAYVGIAVVASAVVNPQLTYSAARMLWEFIS